MTAKSLPFVTLFFPLSDATLRHCEFIDFGKFKNMNEYRLLLWNMSEYSVRNERLSVIICSFCRAPFVPFRLYDEVSFLGHALADQAELRNKTTNKNLA